MLGCLGVILLAVAGYLTVSWLLCINFWLMAVTICKIASIIVIGTTGLSLILAEEGYPR